MGWYVEPEIIRRLGERIRQLREERGLTQHEVSKSLGHRGATRINQVELGRKRLYADELLVLSNLLGCSPCTILLAEDEPSRELIQLFERRPPEQRDEVLDHLRNTVCDQQANSGLE